MTEGRTVAIAQHVISREEEEIASDGEPFCVCLSQYTSSFFIANLALHGVNLIVFHYVLIFSHFSSGPFQHWGSDIGY